MSTYLEKVTTVANNITDMYVLAQMYRESTVRSGFSTIVNITSDKTLSDFSDEYLISLRNEDSVSYPKAITNYDESTSATAFELPAIVKGYDNLGNIVSGAPRDIGINKNLVFNSRIEFNEIPISDNYTGWFSVCYGNGKFVSVVYDSKVFGYSDDGVTWTEDTISSTDRNWHKVCYGDDKFVAVADNSNIFAYSTDGITWTESTISDTIRYWYSVCYGDDKFVAVAYSSNKFAYSTDGITWTEGNISNYSRNWYNICYGDDKFVAVSYSSNIFAYSTDGITWTEGTISDTNRCWKSLCYGNGKYVALVSDSNIFAYSTDGITWTEGTITDTNRYWEEVCYGNGKFVAVASSEVIFAYSDDGITWTEGTISNTNRGWQTACYGNDRFVVLARYSNYFVYSSEFMQYPPQPAPYEVTTDTAISTWFAPGASTTQGGMIEYKIENGSLYVKPNLYSRFIPVNLNEYPTFKYAISNRNAFLIKPLAGTNYMNGIYAFVIADNTVTGLVVYLTKNFVSWKTCNILPVDCDYDIWRAATERGPLVYGVTEGGANQLNKVIQKYFRTLPNGKYAYMKVNNMYENSDDVMVYIGDINSNADDIPIIDIYKDNKYQEKATHGFSLCATNNGEIVLYYNKLTYPALTLYGGRIMKTFNSTRGNYDKEPLNVPRFARYYDMPINNVYSAPEMIPELAITTLDVNDGNVENIPLAKISIALGDAAQEIYTIRDDMYGKYDEVHIHIPNNIESSIIDSLDNTDVDFSSFIGGYVHLKPSDIESTNIIDIINIEFKEGTISDTNRNWVSVCYGNGKFVAITWNSNIFAYSTDGITWTEGTISDTNRYWVSVCYGNGKFVAISNTNSTFAYSTDGITWTEGNISDTNRAWQSVCYGNGKFVAISNTNSTFAYSDDGITWTESTISDTNRNWESVCYGNGKFVVVARYSDYFAYSTDGITWTKGTISDTSRIWYNVCYGDDKFVAIASRSNIFAYSTDGITWTEGNISDTNRYWEKVCYGNGKYVAIVSDSNIFAYSDDGITWTESIISDTIRYWYSICYGDGKFVMIANNSNKFAIFSSNCNTYGCIIGNAYEIKTNTTAWELPNNARERVTAIGFTIIPNENSLGMNNITLVAQDSD